jgi:TPR repeat protein
MLRLARMYDPSGFQQDGPVAAPNPQRALDLYREAAAAGVAEAQRGADALIVALRREAALERPDGTRARDILRRSGVE